MQSDKVIERTSEFFTHKAFKDFEDDLQIRNPPHSELELKCCGYGYFPKVKQFMKNNFRKYLVDAGQFCEQLSTLKIIYNGFDVNDDSLLRIYEGIITTFKKRKIQVLWLQTTNLRKCREEDLIEMFNLISQCGSDHHCREINIQMADWEFEGGYIKYKRLVEIFSNFLTKQIRDKLTYRKFKLQISSWYMKQREAYNFLKDSLSTTFLRQHILKLKNEKVEDKQQEQAPQQLVSMSSAEQSLNFYLQKMDEKFLKPPYPHKKNSQLYSREEEEDYKQKQEKMLQNMEQAEEAVSRQFIKYPNEYITQLRVEDFHKNMINFLGGLLARLPEAQEYHIDMRNWHAMFGMGNLKKTLDTKKNGKQELSSIRNSLGMDKAANRISASRMTANRISAVEVERLPHAAGLKTIYTM